MNAEQTQAARGVMQAFEEGAPIQFRKRRWGCLWHKTESPAWDWSNEEYRIAPFEFHAWLDESGEVVRLIRDKDDIADHSSHRRVTLVVKE